LIIFRNTTVSVLIFVLAFYINKGFPLSQKKYNLVERNLNQIHRSYIDGNYEEVYQLISKNLKYFKKTPYLPSAVFLGRKSAFITGKDEEIFLNALKKYDGFGRDRAEKFCKQAKKSRMFENKKKIVFLDLPGVYSQKDYLIKKRIIKKTEFEVFSVSEEIRCLLRYPPNLLKSFINFRLNFPVILINGSGDYHHLTYFFISQIKEPFSLIVFDQHTDFRNFKNVVFDCGSWVKFTESLKKNYLKEIIIAGIYTDTKDYHSNVSFRFPECEIFKKGKFEKVYTGFLKRRRLKEFNENPQLNSENVYISVDLDCLTEDFVETKWGNGEVVLDELLNAIKNIKKNHKIIGVDVCGLKESPDEKSLKTVSEIVKILKI